MSFGPAASFIWPGTGRAEPDYVARWQKARLLPAAQCQWRFAPFGKPASRSRPSRSVVRLLYQSIDIAQQQRIELVRDFHHEEVARVRDDVGFEAGQ